MGYVDVNRRIVNNIIAGHTSPLLADELNSIQSGFARVLYSHLDNRFAGIPEESTNTYRRLVKPLFEEDFPEYEIEKKYRKKTLERTGKYLIGKRITTGTITDVRVVKNQKGRGSEWLLEVQRTYKAVEETPNPFWARTESKKETVNSPAEDEQEILNTRRNHFCHELAYELSDQRGIGDYHAIYLDLYHHHCNKDEIAVESQMRGWSREITHHLEHEGLNRLTTGGKLHKLYKDFCKQQDKPTYIERKKQQSPILPPNDAPE